MFLIVVARAADVVVLHEQHDGHADVREDLPVGVVERGARIPLRPDLAVQRQVGEAGGCVAAVVAALGAALAAVRGLVPGGHAGVPALVGGVRAHGQARGGHSLAGRDLEDVAIVVVVVRDHVEHERAGHAHAGRVDQRAVVGGQPQAPLDDGPGQGPRPQAIGGKLLAREVHEPDVAGEAPLARQRQEHVGRQQQGGGRRVVVVGARGRSAQPVAAALALVDVLHVRGVVVVGHDHGLAAVAPGDHEHDVALVGLAALVPVPPVGPP